MFGPLVPRLRAIMIWSKIDLTVVEFTAVMPEKAELAS